MANDVFGGLGGLMKGLSGFMPQDDPDVQIMKLQSDVSDLKQQEQEIFAQIGRQAWPARAAAFGELADTETGADQPDSSRAESTRTLQATMKPNKTRSPALPAVTRTRTAQVLPGMRHRGWVLRKPPTKPAGLN